MIFVQVNKSIALTKKLRLFALQNKKYMSHLLTTAKCVIDFQRGTYILASKYVKYCITIREQYMYTICVFIIIYHLKKKKFQKRVVYFLTTLKLLATFKPACITNESMLMFQSSIFCKSLSGIILYVNFNITCSKIHVFFNPVQCFYEVCTCMSMQ